MRSTLPALYVALALSGAGPAAADIWHFDMGHDPVFKIDKAELLLRSEDERFSLTIGCYNDADRSVSFILHTPIPVARFTEIDAEQLFTVSADGGRSYAIRLKTFAGERFILYGEMFDAADRRYDAVLTARNTITLTGQSGLQTSFSVDFFNTDLGKFKKVCRIVT